MEIMKRFESTTLKKLNQMLSFFSLGLGHGNESIEVTCSSLQYQTFAPKVFGNI